MNRFIAKGLKLAEEGIDAEERSENEETVLKLYISAIDYLMVGIRAENDELFKTKVLAQVAHVIERAEFLQQKLNIVNTDSPDLSQPSSPSESAKRATLSTISSGNLVDKTHPNWNIVDGMLSGLDKALPLVEAALHPDNPRNIIMEESFTAIADFQYSIENGDSFRFQSFAPIIFAKLRLKFGLSTPQLRDILLKERALYVIKSPGKSSSFFYYTLDYQYIIKTIPKEEADVLCEILNDYYRHMTNYKHSLLSKFYGLYSMQYKPVDVLNPDYNKQWYFVIMENVFNHNLTVDECYDLKGSTYGRFVSEEEIAKGNIIQKDLNIKKGAIQLKEQDRQYFFGQLHQDAVFLEDHMIMDYSLLVGIHYINTEKYQYNYEVTNTTSYFRKDCGGLLSQSNEQDPNHIARSRSRTNSLRTLPSVEKFNFGLHNAPVAPATRPCIYFVGVIDILTVYGWRKTFERSFKSLMADATTISSVHPTLYRERFESFLMSHCFS